MKRVAILASGGGSNAGALMASMESDHPARTCLVFSNDAAAGVLNRARTAGVPTESLDHRAYPSREAFDGALHDLLTSYRPDIICLAGFMRILTPGFVGRWQGRMLNIHPSLLPAYPGLHTHARALEAGDTYHGCSVHIVTPELDAGPILGQARLAIQPDEDADALAARVLRLEHQLYPTVLRRFALGETDRIDLEADRVASRAQPDAQPDA
ncbi:MAG: phosphoribosylglycinamide formyltransferase [Pseudomonadota bacterium]